MTKLTYEYVYKHIGFTSSRNSRIRYRFIKKKKLQDEGILSYNEFIGLLKERNGEFLQVFAEALKHATSELKSAYFWECVPVSKATIGKDFEFVVTKSLSLSDISQNYSSFQEHFDKNCDEKNVCSFLNLGKDAILVVPCPPPQSKSSFLS